MASDSNGPNPGLRSGAEAEHSGEVTVSPPERPDLQPISETSGTEGILPLLGKPYFACIICKSHVHPPFQVVVPKSLAPFLPPATAPATLTWRGRSWEMRFTGGRQIQRLEAGWRAFAVDNGLRLGDGCVFELVDGGGGEAAASEAGGRGGVVFRVQVLRADIPAAIRGRAGGYTSSTPIVID